MGNKRAEACRETFLLGVVEMPLVAKKDHLVFRQGALYRGDDRVGQVAGEPHIVDLRADTAGKRANVEIDAKMHERVLRRLDRLDAAATPQEMNIPGFDFHALRGFKPTRYSVHVNGPWCITFEFEDGDACRIDFEQYH